VRKGDESIFIWLRTFNVLKGKARPPGPAGIPLLGSLLEAQRDPLHFVLHMARTYGDIAYFSIGPYSGYHLNHPDYIQHVLQLNHTNYNKVNYNFKILKVGLGESVLTSSGEKWLQQRRLIQPAFHRERIARFGSIMIEATCDMLERWQSSARDDQLLDIADEMIRLTLRIVGKSLFSVDLGANIDTIATTFAQVNEDIAHRFRTGLVPPFWIPTPRNLAFKRNRSKLDRIVYEIIAYRRQNGGPNDDLLGMLLEARDERSGEGMTIRQVRDQVMTLMLAGHETTAALLTWTWYLLATHPAIAQNLTRELDEVLNGRLPTLDDLPALEYTEMVLQESMRLYPPVWFFNRTAIEDDEIGGYPIPAGSIVTLSPYTMHRHPAFWQNPEGVDPERFTPKRMEGRHRYAYIPFGGGPRYCIGSTFAMMEAQLILATIAQQYRLVLAPGQPVEPEPLVTLRPHDGLKMRLSPRLKRNAPSERPLEN
jgi:cytochrome P450